MWCHLVGNSHAHKHMFKDTLRRFKAVVSALVQGLLRNPLVVVCGICVRDRYKFVLIKIKHFTFIYHDEYCFY